MQFSICTLNDIWDVLFQTALFSPFHTILTYESRCLLIIRKTNFFKHSEMIPSFVTQLLSWKQMTSLKRERELTHLVGCFKVIPRFRKLTPIGLGWSWRSGATSWKYPSNVNLQCLSQGSCLNKVSLHKGTKLVRFFVMHKSFLGLLLSPTPLYLFVP